MHYYWWVEIFDDEMGHVSFGLANLLFISHLKGCIGALFQAASIFHIWCFAQENPFVLLRRILHIWTLLFCATKFFTHAYCEGTFLGSSNVYISLSIKWIVSHRKSEKKALQDLMDKFMLHSYSFNWLHMKILSSVRKQKKIASSLQPLQPPIPHVSCFLSFSLREFMLSVSLPELFKASQCFLEYAS